ncbi:hypothetical protein PTKIN_Ptkin09bG0104300 [Pterospermum kingtungense]
MIEKDIRATKQVVYRSELVKPARSGKDLLAIHVLSDSDLPLLRAWMTKDHRKTRRDLPVVKKGLKKIAKHFAAMAVFMGKDTEEAFCRWISYASYNVNRVPSINVFMAVPKGKIMLEILLLHHFQGSTLRNESYLNSNSARLRPADQEPDVGRDDLRGLKDGNSSPDHNHNAILLHSISVIRRELPEPSLGWPLLPRKSSPNPKFSRHEARDISVVEWVMSLPNRVPTVVDNKIALHSNQTRVDSETYTSDSTINVGKAEEAIHSFVAEPMINDNINSKDENYVLEYDTEVSVSSHTKDMESNSKPGWPLLRITSSTTSDSFSEYEATKIPMVERVMEAPAQSIENPLPALRRMPNDFGLRCKQFSLRELKQATSGFSPENLIGEGGCSNVYKGCLPSGKPVAVKILKSYKEAWSDFSLEVDIVSSLKHRHITPLIGVCVEDDHLISVYDFFPRGSLEEILHGQNKKWVLPWGTRFKVATAIAEALNYLHNECSPSVIHRDVKSSNILLSDDFQPQLSDFGLAIWGPKDSTYMLESNVVGTFGYIAPEYFMEGRVSSKIDVYSFGVVLLELVSGRRPISSKAQEGQENFIQWAKALLERRNLQALVDPTLDGDFDIAQMHRMVLAASLCLNQLDDHRPKVKQVDILTSLVCLSLLNLEQYEIGIYHSASFKTAKS